MKYFFDPWPDERFDDQYYLFNDQNNPTSLDDENDYFDGQ